VEPNTAVEVRSTFIKMFGSYFAPLLKSGFGSTFSKGGFFINI
jgi:hypothetical protein